MRLYNEGGFKVYEVEVHGRTEYYAKMLPDTYFMPYYTKKDGYHWQATTLCPTRIEQLKPISITKLLKKATKC